MVTPFYVVDDGKGASKVMSTTCGNDMEGVPYIEVSLIEDGSCHSTWDTSKAGEAGSQDRRSDWLPCVLLTGGSGYTPGTHNQALSWLLAAATSNGTGWYRLLSTVNAAGDGHQRHCC